MEDNKVKTILYMALPLLLCSCSGSKPAQQEHSVNDESIKSIESFLVDYKDYYYSNWEPHESKNKNNECFYYTADIIKDNDSIYLVLSGNNICFVFYKDIIFEEVKGVIGYGKDSILFQVFNTTDEIIPNLFSGLILQDPTPSFLYQEKTVPQDLCIDDFIHVYKLESDKHWEKTDKSYEWFLNQTYDRIVER